MWVKHNLNPSESKLTINFTQPAPEFIRRRLTGKTSLFNIKSESSYSANQSNGPLELGLKKQNCIAWVDIPDCEYQDHVIEALIRLDNFEGYAATGIIFHIMDEDTYHLALVSSKGYFRLDSVKNNSPKTLIAWTEISGFDGSNINIKIITFGASFIFLVNGKWLGEIKSDETSCGRPGFALASYEHDDADNKEGFVCKAFLDYFSIDTRSKYIKADYLKWTDDSNINAEERLRLAETFAVMNEPEKALEQIFKAWKRRDEVISAVSASEVRTKKELLLAARMAFRLELYNEADKYIDTILDQWADSPEGKFALTEKIKILYELNKYSEIKEFVISNPFKIIKDIDYYTILARCHWELNDYAESAGAWEKAFELDTSAAVRGQAGVYAANAANAYELAKMNKNALARYIDAGKIFLNEDNRAELDVIMPKLSLLGEKNWEARALVGKWAFSMEDYFKCSQEFSVSNKLRNALKPRPEADPALYYLWGLVFSLHGKIKTAIRLLDKAVKLAPDYGLFRFKLAEIKLINGDKNPALADELKLALENIEDKEGQMAEHAGNLLHSTGNTKSAKYFFDKAKSK